MVTMVDKNGVEVNDFIVNVYDANGDFAYGGDLGKIESNFPGVVSNYETALSVAREYITEKLGRIWLDDFEVLGK